MNTAELDKKDDGWTTVPRKWLEGYQFSSREQINQYRVALYVACDFDKSRVRELMLQVEGMTIKEARTKYQDQTKSICAHEWVDARNAVVQSGEICLKCNSIREGNRDQTKSSGEAKCQE